MDNLDVVLAIVAAIVAIIAFTECFVYVVRAFRKAEYEKQKAHDLELKATEPTALEFRAFDAAKKWVAPLHNEGIKQQNDYYDCLTRSVSALSLALLALIFGLALPKSQHWYATFFAAIEALAFVYVLQQFRKGRHVNAAWVDARIRSEIVRQAGMVMAANAAAEGRTELDSNEQTKWEKIARSGTSKEMPKTIELSDHLEKLWINNHDLLAGYVANLTSDAFQAYLSERARRQIRWFRTSIKRLSDNHHLREHLLRLVFIGCTIIAFVKLSLSIPIVTAPPQAKSVVLVVLLIGAVWASAYTGFYLGNNQRSLYHRYNVQVRQIRDWLRECEKTQSLDPAAMQRNVMWFETLMNDELIDWVRITDHDSMELTS